MVLSFFDFVGKMFGRVKPVAPEPKTAPRAATVRRRRSDFAFRDECDVSDYEFINAEERRRIRLTPSSNPAVYSSVNSSYSSSDSCSSSDSGGSSGGCD